MYDVTSWVPKHPGGNIIGLAAGREATALLYSYHPNSIVDVLKKYYIGEVKEYPFLLHFYYFSYDIVKNNDIYCCMITNSFVDIL